MIGIEEKIDQLADRLDGIEDVVRMRPGPRARRSGPGVRVARRAPHDQERDPATHAVARTRDGVVVE